MNDRNKASYHHGELPEALMKLAVAEIAAQGTEKLSLRALARAAGVSQSAPYRHFPTKRCLLAAIATQGFQLMQRRMERALAHKCGPEEKFLALSIAYIEFALSYPTHYQLMFGSVLDDFSTYDHLTQASEAAFELVLGIQTELRDKYHPQADARHLAGVTWAAVHGIASLLLNVPDGPDSDPSRPRQAVGEMRKDIQASVALLLGHFCRPSP